MSPAHDESRQTPGPERPLAERSERELVTAARAGTLDAFDVLLARHQDRLFSFLVRWLGDADTAQDVLQRAAVLAYRRLDRFDPTRAFKPWLYAVAVNEARSLQKSRTRRRERESRFSRESLELVSAGPDARLDALRILEHGLAALSAADRQLLLLRFADDLSVREVARILGVPSFVVKMRTVRARRRFRAVVEELREDEP